METCRACLGKNFIEGTNRKPQGGPLALKEIKKGIPPNCLRGSAGKGQLVRQCRYTNQTEKPDEKALIRLRKTERTCSKTIGR